MMATMTIASSRLGIARMMSMKRMIGDIDDAAVKKPDDQAEHDAERQRQRHDDAADEQRQPGAVDDAREHVAADIVGAEREGPGAALRPGRRLQEVLAELLDRRCAGATTSAQDRDDDQEDR